MFQFNKKENLSIATCYAFNRTPSDHSTAEIVVTNLK